MRDWYNLAPPPKADSAKVKWIDVLTHWLDVSLDLHETFGIDVESGVLEQRTWWWLHDRVLDLLNKPSRLRTSLNLPATMSA